MAQPIKTRITTSLFSINQILSKNIDYSEQIPRFTLNSNQLDVDTIN